ncbi:glycoside hydrolase superfamily, partial [Xylariales sp. PMI_506]
GIYGANFQPQNLSTSSLTHVLYAFANINTDGTVVSSDSYADTGKHYPGDSWDDTGNDAYGVVKQLYILKQNNRTLKVLLSIGGWSYSAKFPPVAANAGYRQQFASSAVQMMVDYGMDGIDIDWEYPANTEEANNFVLLLQAVRAALDNYSIQHALGYRFMISIACPAGPANYMMMNLAGMDQYVDAWNLMAYDYAGGWDSTTGHQANLYYNPSLPLSTKYNTEQAVLYYLAQGIAPTKLTLGMPLYGRSFESTGGLGQPYSGVGTGSMEAGVWLYKELPRAGASENWDTAAGASWSYDPGTGELITYDNARSAANKARYVLQRGLGGAFFWEASGDRGGAQSLVGAVAGGLGWLDGRKNNLVYPTSQYDNIRSGVV